MFRRFMHLDKLEEANLKLSMRLVTSKPICNAKKSNEKYQENKIYGDRIRKLRTIPQTDILTPRQKKQIEQ